MLRRIMNGSYALLPLFFAAGLVMSCGGGAGGGNTGNTTYTLSGAVSGAVPQGVMLTLSGAGTGTTTTNTGGTYSFAGLSNGYYTITATRANYKFTPASQVVPINYANAVATTIVSENAYSISGNVAVATAGVTMTLTGSGLASSLTATTDASGNYTFNALVTGDYTVTPGKNSQYVALSHILTTYSFTPANQPVTISNLNLASVNFVTTVTTTNAYNISGTITQGTRDPIVASAPFILEGVTVWLNNPGYTIWISTTTDASGNYTFSGIPNGTYTVGPSHFHTGGCPHPTEYTFSPLTQAITVSGADLADADFAENIYQGGCAVPF
jgi:protocatechuate 3,4-dioxygenase beta subunit